MIKIIFQNLISDEINNLKQQPGKDIAILFMENHHGTK
jgi:hypothetical protein